MKPIILILLSLTVSTLFGQLTLYKAPHLEGKSCSASIASNNLGDLMGIYCNNNLGAVYYYRSHTGTTWTSPKAIPGQNYDAYSKALMNWTDVTSTSDNQFHAIWSGNTHVDPGYNLYYAAFDPTTGTWSSPVLLLEGRVAESKLITNTWNDDLILVWDWNLGGLNKDVFIKVKTKTGWQPEVNITRLTRTSSTGQAPHGDFAETNTFVAVDETDGYVYMCWKEDELNGSDWELRTHVALFDPTYKMVWHEQVTSEYWGWHMLPSITALNGKAVVAFAWTQMGSYNYVIFKRVGNTLTYDPKVLEYNWFAQITGIWYAFYNRLMAHGDEIVFVYPSMWLGLRMLRMKDWVLFDNRNAPINLSDTERMLYVPFDSYSDPKIGILTAFHNYHEGPDLDARETLAEICFSIYSYPRPAVRSALNVQVTQGVDRSFFKKFYFNVVTWENNPVNVNRAVNVAKFRIYRKLKSEPTGKYVAVGDVDGSTLKFTDRKSVSGQNPYDYYVTCVDDKGNESKLPSD